MTRHETLAGRFVLNGETWLGSVYSPAQNETDMVYQAGGQTVWITYGGPASERGEHPFCAAARAARAAGAQ